MAHLFQFGGELSEKHISIVSQVLLTMEYSLEFLKEHLSDANGKDFDQKFKWVLDQIREWGKDIKDSKEVENNLEEYDPLIGEIQKLSPELREKILKEDVTAKLEQRSDIGWGLILDYINFAPYCEKNERITKVTKCHQCTRCYRDDLCSFCLKERKVHDMLAKFV